MNLYSPDIGHDKHTSAVSPWQQVKQTVSATAADVKQTLNPSTMMQRAQHDMTRVQQGMQPSGGKKAKRRRHQSPQAHKPQQQQQQPSQQSAQGVLEHAGEEAFVLPPGTTIILPEDAGGEQFVTTTKSTIKKVDQ